MPTLCEKPHLFGASRSNINKLMPRFTVGLLGFGAPCKYLLCKVDPIEENYDVDMAEVWRRYGNPKGR